MCGEIHGVNVEQCMHKKTITIAMTIECTLKSANRQREQECYKKRANHVPYFFGVSLSALRMTVS